MEYPRPLTTVDVVLFTIVDDALAICLVQRDQAPFRGRFALPGGFVHTDEDSDADAAARRVLREKVGVKDVHIEQLYTFSGRARDPRDWSVTISYCAVAPNEGIPRKSSVRLVPVKDIQALPFDHDRIVERAVERVRSKASYSSLPAFLLPRHFTYPQLQRVYEIATGESLDPSSFRRKMLELQTIEPVQLENAQVTRGRPPQYYRLADRTLRAFQRKI
ncbi:NUDIX hydrolase [Reyranella sp.]|uniref:NUDIX hydrolase n=1 Tax=Reyranella sp. TaxID=1929291 RepID=UPI003BA86358